MKRALDLFCGAGGASKGLHRAGYEVCGIDIHEQPNYPFHYEIGDATSITTELLREFDFVWASPPCQAFTAYKRRKNHVKKYPNYIPRVRKMLKAAGVPYVIENVPGAPLQNPVTLCGSMFLLNVRRHRIFETNFPVKQPKCRHELQTPRFPPATNRKNKRKTVEVGVWRIPLEVQQHAMGINWMNVKELSQAIPPVYAEYIARQLTPTPGGSG